MICAGNRREELNTVERVAGTTWHQGAVGNATSLPTFSQNWEKVSAKRTEEGYRLWGAEPSKGFDVGASPESCAEVFTHISAA